MNNQGQVTRLMAWLLALTLALALVPWGDPPARAASSTLVISEVLYDPTGTEPDREWIEIYNLGGTSINLTNYKVGDEETSGGTEGMLGFPSGASIAPGQVIVIANKATAFSAAYGFNPDYEMLESDPAVPNMVNTAWASGSVALQNDSDEVLLLDPSDSAVDALSWGSSTFAFDPPAPDVAEGHSLERRPAGADTDTAGDWMDQSTPVPGNVVLNLVKVVSPADSGPGTLRQALLDAAPGDAITFSPTVFPPGSPVTILVQSVLPTLNKDNVTIDASAAGVTLDGSQTPALTNGLIVEADDCIIRGLTIQNFSSNGVLIAAGVAVRTRIEGNTIAFNERYGVLVATCDGNTITQNSIYSNTLAGIRSEGDCVAMPQITGVTIGPTEIVTGTTVPNAQVEFFSDDDDEGRVYEGYTLADVAGDFSFDKVGGFTGPNLTVTSTDADGDTSEFSQPAHLLWTLLLYLNGDNDLEEFMFDTITNTVAAGPSPRANVLALVDGCTTTTAYSGTVLYDVTRGEATPLSAPLTVTGERNMGDGQTLVDFVTWGRAHYPARHTLLAIVDHGGGWAPSGGASIPGTLLHRNSWLAGNSGLSWDFSSDYDYLDSQEIRQAMATITDNGADPLDVVFYDVCLMGMLEVAYQIKDYASFFVSSQNIGWAPVGPQGRYIQTIQGIEPTATPRQMAELLVQAYADGTPPQEHPFTISAADLASLPTVATAANDLAVAISQTLAGPDQATILHGVYSAAQKIDYDSDFYVEPATDGFVDLYDFALRASQQFSDPTVVAAAQNVMTALDAAIVAEEHRSGSPWMALDREWNLDDVHGLSIFLPLGEDLELPIVITETSPITPSLVISRHLRLRDMYSGDQLQFVEDTAWGGLIATYYDVVSSPVPTDTTEGPVDGLLTPDVTPPQTTITVTGAFAVGETITVTWVATDTQTGVAGATWWYRPPRGQWTAVLTQTGSSGVFRFTLSHACVNGFAVRAIDKAGNVEPLDSGSNMIAVNVQPCIYMPLIFKHCL